uniref:Transcription initiation factor TFIID subunit 13 n=1 Tax=Panagrellus redivivus TaxID=6233 RepID=A0A7E4ZWR6_PANRE
MLVGYGDVEKPRRDTVDVLVELTLQYLNNLAGYMKHLAPNKKISLEVLYYMVRNDQAKFMRVRELLKMNEELKKAKKDYRTGDETPFD